MSPCSATEVVVGGPAQGPATGGVVAALCGAPTTGSALDRDSHGTRRTRDDLLGCIHGRRGQVGHLDLRDFADLGGGYRTDLVFVRLGAALLDARGLLDQFRRRWRLGDEGERAVLENGDLYWDHVSALGLCGSVVLPAEVHDVDAMRPKSRADWRRWRGLSGGQLHLDNRRDPLPWRHCLPFRSSLPDRRRARQASPCRRSTPAP